METSVYTAKIKKVLGKGEGIKVALFDTRARSVLSNVVPHSLFLENSYFLFEAIDSRRSKMGKVTCSVFIEPASISLLVKELRDPCYESYYIYFLNAVTDHELSVVADSDKLCVVREIYEIYVDLHQIETFLFTIDPRPENIFGSRDNVMIRDAERISSLLKTLEISPSVYTIPTRKKIARKIQDFMEGYDGKRAKLLVLDRSIDMITPLLHEWRYQSMIHEYCDYENGIVKAFGQSFSLFNDKFFDENKFQEISKVSDSLKSYTARIQVKRTSSTLYPEGETRTMETHLNIHNCILKECMKNAAISDAEYGCIDHTYASYDSFLKQGGLSFAKKAKLFLIYLHSIGYNFTLEKEEMLKHKILRSYPEYIEIVDRYSAYVRNWPGKRYKYKFASEADPKLGYQPPIRRIIRKFIQRKAKDIEALGKDEGDSKSLVVYVNGGLTYSEYYSILCETKGLDVHIVSDYMIGFKDIMQVLGSEP